MEYTLSKHAKDVIIRRDIKEEWIELVLSSPTCTLNIAEDEVAYYATVETNENRCLKVVVNLIEKRIITVYFDRGMRKRGCK